MAAFRVDDAFLTPGKNSFGFLRLMLASAVVFEHTFALAGLPIPTHMAAKLAVDGFFFLSGMLVTQSFQHCRSWGDYLWRRTLRIFPGYWLCIFITALVIGPIAWLLQHRTIEGYFAEPGGPLIYIARGLPLFGHPGAIHDIFATTPYGPVVNGSLWTLPVEYLCYVALAAIGVLGVLKKAAWLTLVAFAAFFLLHLFPEWRLPSPRGLHLPSQFIDVNVTELYVFFLLGVATYLYRDQLKISDWLGAIACAVILTMIAYESMNPSFQFASRALRVFALPCALLWLANALPFRQFDNKRDLSYGVYIYAFPVTQLLILAGAATWGGWPLFLIVYGVTAALAFTSWHAVEHPAMKFKRLFAKRS
jgi:peptidoglycan/LPS O-acetylase OafA/YrhL